MRVRAPFNTIILLLIGSAILILLSGCREQPDDVMPVIYIPPTAAVTNTPIPVVTQTEVTVPEVTATPSCTNVLTFLSDVTIPDGTVVFPGERLDKQWEVQNNGSCNWDSAYQVQLIAGPDMGVNSAQALHPARSGTSFTIRMVFTAPQEPGAYRSAWQAYTPDGTEFGDPFFMDIQVLDSPPDEDG